MTGLLVTACSVGSSSGSGSTAAEPARQAARPEPTAAGSGASGASAGSTASFVLATQSIIHTADLTLRVKHVKAVAGQVSALVTADGGYVADEQDSFPHFDHATPIVTLTVKIPVTQFYPALAKMESFGKQVSFSQHAQNVTQQVADVSSRVASAQAAIRQLRALLGRAGNVSSLLQVQDEINSQEAALEALLAQQRALAHETSYGTVTVTLVGPHVVIVHHKKKHSGGFGTGLKAGWHALVVVVKALLTALGAIIPFAVPVALLLGIGFAGRRRFARRRRAPAAEPPATAES